jgi:U3 small nucleolar RNA-associated protein 12
MISYFSILKYSDQIIFNVMYVVLLLLINFIFFQIEEFRLNLDEKGAEPEKVRSFDHAGHRSDVRTVAFSSDNTAIVSASHESIKIWNRASVVS